jgi:SAM-dependent methyltransferase
MSDTSKQAEKDYLRRSAGGEWELSKPFPPTGQVGSDEHAQHLLDFAVMLRVLALKPSDLILDLGAGSCWVSDWLRRFGFRSLAVDISWDMLNLGRKRLGSANGLVAGDLERLPFAAGSFSKACCLNAFHHVPDMGAALREIRRVLSPEGVVFFSEPGEGHAAHPTSIAATRNYGVQENDILITPFMEACLAAGFADVRLHPISHIVPLFELTAGQWAAWARFNASQRPTRALQKLYRSALEFLGIGKKDLLFEEAFAIRLLRELQPVIAQHPVITAHCTPFTKPTRATDAATLEFVTTPQDIRAGKTIRVLLRVANSGTTTWNAAGSEEVRLGVQLLNARGEMIERNYSRHSLPPLLPGGRCEAAMAVAAPTEPGPYQMRFDVVREGVHWFEMSGSRPVTLSLTVTN